MIAVNSPFPTPQGGEKLFHHEEHDDHEGTTKEIA